MVRALTAAANKNNSSAAVAREKVARDSARAEVKKLTFDGKSVSNITSYTLYSTTANDVKGTLGKYPQWFIHSGEDAANYVAVAVYENGQNSSCVVFVIEAK